MDRAKKSKIQHSSDSLFILGKNSDRKRDGSSQITTTSKKARITSSSLHSASGSGSNTLANATSPESWEDAINTECENVDLIAAVIHASDQQNSDRIVSLVCAAIKNLSSQKSKNDTVLILSLLYLAKIRPHIFENDKILAAIISLLKTDSQHNVRHSMKSNTSVFVMAANLLARGHYDKKKWPESFLKVYIEDAVNERFWVDSEECSFFAEHISKFIKLH